MRLRTQCTRGTIGLSKLKPVEGSRATVLPDRSPYRASVSYTHLTLPTILRV